MGDRHVVNEGELLPRTYEEWREHALEQHNRLCEHFAKNGALIGEAVKPPALKKDGSLKRET